MRGELENIYSIFSSVHSQKSTCVYCCFVARDPMRSYKEQDDFYSKMKHLHTLGSVCSTYQSNYNSYTSSFFYISERPASHFPTLFSYLPGLTERCLQPKSPRLLRFPRRWSASDVDDSISEKWKSRSQTICRGPITPSPRLLLATLNSGPHLMGHNIILRHVPALYTSSKHNSVAKAQ